MGKEQLRLFGFELSFYEGPENSMGCSEEVNHSGKSFEKIFSRVGKSVKDKSKSRKLEKGKYECQFCLKKFTNSQALGGHQNVHKSERLKKRRMQLQPKSTNLCFAAEPPQGYNVVSQHCSLQSTSTSFNSLGQIQNLYCNMAGLCHYFPLTSHNHFEESACCRHIVIKPSPSYISKDGQSLYNQLGLAPPALHNTSRNGNDRAEKL